VKYPTEYNGCIACAPDPVDFRALSPLNIYASPNAYKTKSKLQLVDSVTGTARTYTGDMLASLKGDYLLEEALGGIRSGGQIRYCKPSRLALPDTTAAGRRRHHRRVVVVLFCECVYLT
jgi:hypothetical protein